MVWYCVSFAVVMIALLFGIAIKYDEGKELEKALSNQLKINEYLRRESNRKELALEYDVSIMKMDVESLIRERDSLQREVAKYEDLVMQKNREIIKLKSLGRSEKDADV